MSKFKLTVAAGLAALLGAALVGPGATAGTAGTVRREALLKNASGGDVGVVRFIRREDLKVSIRVSASGLTPGFHGFHVHTTGTCDPAATDTGGNPSPFFTAGGHYNPTMATHGTHAGDMPPLYAAADGTARLTFVTDRFKMSDLMDSDGSAVILHAGPDNLAHIPATTSTGGERYHSHLESVFGPDTPTKATGDAGARFACGVVQQPAS